MPSGTMAPSPIAVPPREHAIQPCATGVYGGSTQRPTTQVVRAGNALGKTLVETKRHAKVVRIHVHRIHVPRGPDPVACSNLIA
jgi:uncharacterized membrane protein YadS